MKHVSQNPLEKTIMGVGHPKTKGSKKKHMHSSKNVSVYNGTKNDENGLKYNVPQHKGPVSIKYVNKRLKEQTEQPGRWDNFINTMVGMSPYLLMSSIPLLGGVALLIKRIYNNARFNLAGCDGVIDPISRAQCESLQIDKLIAQFRSNMSKCSSTSNPQECEKMLYAEIEKLNNKKLKILQTTVPTPNL